MSTSSLDSGTLGISSGARPTKRSKIEVACEICRLRKSRCDGGRPKCSACLKRRDVGPYCVYSLSSYSVTPRTDALRLDYTNVPFSGDNNASLITMSESNIHRHHSPGTNQRPAVNSIMNTSSVPSSRTSEAEIRVLSNAVDNDKNAKSDWKLQAGLLAASSSAKFFKTVFGNSDYDDSQKDISNPHETRPNPEQNSYHTSGASTAFDLPRRKVADDLLQRFWTYVYIPWLDRVDFEDWYQGLWISDITKEDQVEERIRYATLNIIFALIYRTEPDFDDEDQLAQIHFGRAQELLRLNVLNLNHMSLLYALLLMLQWYQSVNDLKSCSALIKLCFVVAQNLGIDDAERVSSFNQRKREMARRAWHGCILMDRIIAMVSGSSPRFSQITAKQTPLFANIDDRFLVVSGEDGEQPPEKFSAQTFFLHFCRLHLILGDILVEHHQAVDINHMMEIDKSLHEFDDALPDELRYGVAQTQTLGQMVHLKTRYLYIRILLFRPCFIGLLEGLKRGSSVRFSDVIMQQGVLKCLDAARALLDLLVVRHTAGERGPGLIPQWWHTVAYVYAAATVMIAAHASPTIMESHNGEDLSKSIQQGFSILDSYKRYREPALRCKKALQILYSRYVMHENAQQQSQSIESDVTDMTWAWEGLPELFDHGAIFDLGLTDGI